MAPKASPCAFWSEGIQDFVSATATILRAEGESLELIKIEPGEMDMIQRASGMCR